MLLPDINITIQPAPVKEWEFLRTADYSKVLHLVRFDWPYVSPMADVVEWGKAQPCKMPTAQLLQAIQSGELLPFVPVADFFIFTGRPLPTAAGDAPRCWMHYRTADMHRAFTIVSMGGGYLWRQEWGKNRPEKVQQDNFAQSLADGLLQRFIPTALQYDFTRHVDFKKSA